MSRSGPRFWDFWEVEIWGTIGPEHVVFGKVVSGLNHIKELQNISTLRMRI